MRALFVLLIICLFVSAVSAETYHYKKVDGEGNPAGLTASTCRQGGRRIEITEAEYGSIAATLKAERELADTVVAADKTLARDAAIEKFSVTTGASEADIRAMLD